MRYYIGLDVSQRQTAICVMDGDGTVICEGGALSRPHDIYGWIKNRVDIEGVERCGLEAGTFSSWLVVQLQKLGLEMVCLEAFHAHRFIATQRNKTDKNDARGLAQLVRMGEGFMKLVVVRSQTSQELRALLAMREHLVRHRVGMENHIRGIIKPFGLVIERGGVCATTFRDRVIEAICLGEDRGVQLRATLMPSLDLYRSSCHQLTVLDKQVKQLAAEHPICKRLMTIPGVGPVTSLSFVAAIDYPERFARSQDVGAYFGLTPRQFQSGDVNYTKGISRRGDPMVRRHLVNAATSLLVSSKRWCPLKAWGIALAKKQGFARAKVAVARKLAIIMHRMWINGQDFQWQSVDEQEIAALHAA